MILTAIFFGIMTANDMGILVDDVVNITILWKITEALAGINVIVGIVVQILLAGDDN